MAVTDLTNQEKLEEIYELTVENHDILRSMRRQQNIANAFRILYWVVILASLGGVYYYVSPIIQAFSTSAPKIEQTMNQLNTFRAQFPEAKMLEQFLHGTKPSEQEASTTVQ
jgi:hypothetical protein